MKPFLDHNFLLKNKTAERLYHEYASVMPIIDYHNHLWPDQIAENKQFDNITQIWLNGDHYKWRAMRAQGISEKYCTGDADDKDKFMAWSGTVPYTLRNPLYHWTHLELQRYFDVYEMLNEKSALSIWSHCNELIQTPDYTVKRLINKMNVRVICTTDDPLDDLRYHQQIELDQNTAFNVFPAFRPDKAMQVDDSISFNTYLTKLEEVSGISISSYADYIQALKSRHDYFASHHCNISDHGLEQLYAEDYTEQQIHQIFAQVRSGKSLTTEEIKKFKSAVLIQLAEWNAEKGWVQQFHLGALRNNNTRMLRQLGPDTGWDSIGDFSQAYALSRFLDRLDNQNKLTKTILYNLNPADNEILATMIGNFNDGSIAGKIQWGSGWWFLDQKDGMTKQLNALSNMGLLSKFIGMLTDSRSFLSFPRHEYFRRILCNMFGEDIEAGELPNDINWTGKIIQDICYNNAVDYFNWKQNPESKHSLKLFIKQ